jgi:hypothetical protein
MPAQGKAGLSFEDQQGLVLVLLAIAVEEPQLLIAMRRVVGGVKIQHDPLGRLPPRANE